jgi:sugar phosphate isomerase/epimerase
MKMVSRFINTFGDRITHIHMSDNRGEDDEHLAIGKGMIDFETVVAELKKIGYKKTITFEVFFGGKKAVIDSRKKIEKMWGKNK